MVVTDGSDSGDGSDTRVAVVVTALAVVVTNKQTNKQTRVVMGRKLQVLLSSFAIISSVFLFT